MKYVFRQQWSACFLALYCVILGRRKSTNRLYTHYFTLCLVHLKLPASSTLFTVFLQTFEESSVAVEFNTVFLEL